MFTTSKFIDNRIQWKGREDFGVAQVGLHYKQGRFPLWFEKLAKKWSAKPANMQKADNYGTIQAFINEYNESHWFDHVGFLRIDTEQFLVAEPYGLTTNDLECIRRFIKENDLNVLIEAAGSHYPTHTIRLIFSPVFHV